MPTPVSALIHAATMVTAGVYLLMRSSPLIEYSSTVLLLCLWLGAITTVFSSLIGLFQQDIKKVIAYSTMSRRAQKYNMETIIFRNQTICVECCKPLIFSQVTKAQDYSLNNLLSNKGLNCYFSLYALHVAAAVAPAAGTTPVAAAVVTPAAGAVRQEEEVRANAASRTRMITEQLYILNYVTNILEFITKSSRWVGTSEAIRLALIYIFFYLFIIIFIYISVLCYAFEAVALLRTNINKVIPLLSDGTTGGGLRLACGEKSYLTYKTTNTVSLTGVFIRKFLKIRGSYIFRTTWQRRYYVQQQQQDDNANTNANVNINARDPFFEWLAGLIDGQGCFFLSKNGFAYFKLIMDSRDKKILYDIRNKLGGSIHIITKKKKLKYQLRDKKGLITLLEGVNGLIRNPTRMLEMNKLCQKYKIELLFPKPLLFNSGWLSGFVDSEATSVHLEEDTPRVLIVMRQKNKYLLDPLVPLYGGRVEIPNSKFGEFKYVICKKNELFYLIEEYFSEYPLKTKKLIRINLIREFYLKKFNKGSKNIRKLCKWIEFKNKWEKYID